MIRVSGYAWIAALLLAGSAAHAQTPAQTPMQHQHGHAGQTACAEPSLACATAATPYLAPDGRLWLAWVAAGRVSVARSDDRGKSFSTPVAVTPTVERVDTGPDARPRIVADRTGRLFVSYGVFKDKAYNATAYVAQSTDGGASFASPRALTDDPASQRFETLALDPDGAVFAAWLDKRNAVAARAAGRPYAGAALAFAWLDGRAGTVTPARIAQDETCECCRLGIAFAGPGRPVVLFRNVFGGTVRDHAITTFVDPETPGPVYRVSTDDWAIDACPHHGPSLAIGPDGAYHAAWFTDGKVRQGLFYARSTDGGRSFSAPMTVGNPDRQPARPYLLTVGSAVWLAWKEFDGSETVIDTMVSHDGGASWSKPAATARTADASDHPLLVSDGHQAMLSWLSAREGYRLLPLEATQ